jgi:hypothetical protein
VPIGPIRDKGPDDARDLARRRRPAPPAARLLDVWPRGGTDAVPMRLVPEVLLRLVVLSTFAAFVSGCATRASQSPHTDQRPASAITLGEVLLRDNFDDPAAGWLSRRSSEPEIEQGYLDGEYFLRLSASFKGPYRGVGSTRTFANTHVAVEGRLVAGTEARWVGVGCRVTAKDGIMTSGYVLGVFPATGEFALGRQHTNDVVSLVPHQASETIRRGTAPNRVELTCAGSTIVARINGTEVASVQDGAYDKGWVAVFVGRSGSISVEARFDNLVVTEALVEPLPPPRPRSPGSKPTARRRQSLACWT